MSNRSLYWKICATFLAVVFVSSLAGSTVFVHILNRLSGPVRNEMLTGLAQLACRDLERYFAAGGSIEGVSSFLGTTYVDFPLVTVLYAGADGIFRGHLEHGREDLTAIFREIIDHKIPVSAYKLRYLGHGRGWVSVMKLGASAHRGLALVAAHGALEELRPAILSSGLVALLVIFVVAATLGMLVFRVLASRLAELRRCLVGLARGELTLRVQGLQNDEIGDVGRSFNQMADRLAQLVGELEEVDRRRRQFLADISHELKTPLTVLRGHMEQLVPDPQGPVGAPGGAPVGERLAVAYVEVDRLGLLIEDLLELARLDSPRFELARQEEVLQRVAAHALARLKLAFANRRIQVHTRFSPEPLRRSVDARRLEQVLLNLLQNALQGLSEGGTIEVDVREEEGRAVLAVGDDGPGIPPEERERVFERFVTGRGSRGGTGLGLSIVKRLVEAHGGTVRFDERPGRGTIARIELL